MDPEIFFQERADTGSRAECHNITDTLPEEEESTEKTPLLKKVTDFYIDFCRARLKKLTIEFSRY